MTPFQKKLSVAGAVLVLAIGYLAYAGVQMGRSYYLHVDAFLADADSHPERVRLHGRVGRDGIRIDDGAVLTDFQLLGESHSLPIRYDGAVPDLFKADCEVVVEGQLRADGVFHADKLMTKCASKYESHDDLARRPV